MYNSALMAGLSLPLKSMVHRKAVFSFLCSFVYFRGAESGIRGIWMDLVCFGGIQITVLVVWHQKHHQSSWIPVYPGGHL